MEGASGLLLRVTPSGFRVMLPWSCPLGIVMLLVVAVLPAGMILHSPEQRSPQSDASPLQISQSYI